VSEDGRWVGRAKPPPPPPPPVDPYWDTGTGPIVYLADRPPRRRGSGRTVVLVVVGVLAAACASGAVLYLLGTALLHNALASGQPTPSASSESAEPVVTRTTVPPKKPGLRVPVRDGQFQFVVTGVSCGHESVGESFVTRKAQGQFCIVTLTVRNVGTEDRTFADSFQEALDADGREYRADTAAGVIVNENADVVLNVVKPGHKLTGKIVFDVPDDAELATLKLHDSPFSNGAVVTLPS
jgi:hypothetical protein